MPTSGKSTIGAELARQLEWPLLDVDRWMEERQQMPLAQIIAAIGKEATLSLETKCLRENDLHRTIVSTPGSIIYNDVHEILNEQTDIVWLDVPCEEIAHRLATDPDPHRADQIIGIKEIGLEALYNERTQHYRKWAKVAIRCAGKSIEEITAEILGEFNSL